MVLGNVQMIFPSSSHTILSMKGMFSHTKHLSVKRISLWIFGIGTLCALSFFPDEFVSNPSPKTLGALLLFLPGIWFFAQWIVSHSSLQKDAVGIVPGLALALWILSVHVSGLLLKDFYAGMAVGTITLGCLGYITLEYKGRSRVSTYAYPPLLWWSAVICTLLLLPTVALKDAWDKLSIVTGHFSITEQIVNGIYPPRHLTFANVVLPYHYGVDTLFAMVRSTFRLRFDIAIDLVTTALFFYSARLYGHIGVRLFGKKVGPFAACLGTFSSGFPFLFGFGFNDMPEPVISNWFQQPWTLGIPMFLTLFLMLTNIETEKKASPSSLAAIMLVTMVLGIAQTALYGIFVGSVFVWAALTWLIVIVRSTGKESTKRPHHLIDIVYAVVAGAFISLFISQTSSLILGAISQSIVPRDGVLRGSWSQMILWNLQCFSIPFLFGIMGMIRARKMSMPALIMALGSLFVFNGYTYLYSWDIVKFTQVVWLPLAIFAAGYLAYLLTHGRYYWRVAALVPSVCLVAANMMFLWHWGSEGFRAWYIGDNVGMHTALWMEFPRKNIPPDFVNALAWVRQRVRAGEITLLPSEERTADAVVLAGLPVLLTGWGDHSLGFSLEDISRRNSIYENISSDVYQQYADEGVRWIVFSPESSIAPQINEWLSQQLITPVAEFGDTIVYEFTFPRVDS